MGYAAMVLTTTPLSITCGRSPARCAETATARPHGPPPTITRSASVAIGLISRSGDADGARGKRALYADDLIAASAHTHVGNLRLDERLYAVEVATRLYRQICKVPSFRCSRLPAVEPLVPRHRTAEHVQIAGELLVDLAIGFVPGAEADPVQRVEHVELGDGEIGETVNPRSVADDDAVEPATAARTAGRRSKLVAERANLGRQGLVELSRQRPVPDARCIRLDDSDNRIELAGRDPHAGCFSAGGRAARRDVWIGAVIDVEDRALRTLEQHRGTADYRAMDLETHVFGKREQSLREALQNSQRVVDVRALRARHRELDVGVRDSTLDQLSQPLRIPQVEDADPAPPKFVLVCRADPASRRADLLAGRALAVDQLVIRQHEMGAIAHIQASLNVDAIRNELVYLREQRLDVQNDSIANRTTYARVENSARNLVEDERLVADVHGVAGIGAALIANYPVGALREDINELALAFVSPLGADDDDGAYVRIEHAIRGDGKSKRPENIGALVQSTSRRVRVNARPEAEAGPRPPSAAAHPVGRRSSSAGQP